MQRTKPYSVERHPKRPHIERDLAKGVPILTLSERYGISRRALQRYKDNKLPLKIAEASELKDLRQAENLLAEIQRVMGRVDMVYDACHEYLLDPEDPTKYDLGPRADEIEVSYFAPKLDGNGTVKRKERLQSLIDQVLGGRGSRALDHITWKIADPRELILKAADRLNHQLELLAKIQGQLKEVTINILNTPVWIEIKGVFMDVTRDHPEILEEFLSRIENIGALNNERNV